MTLQWGHGSEAVDDFGNDRYVVAAYVELQWGHGSEAVDDRRGRQEPHRSRRASMGPRLGSRG
ncbi:hypothetical protein SAMN05444166_6697 [Singulisphaera sp. GP187]|nr:hypothetical protein SAMN05444166_6697 [Singulisphaera sp. GP187]